MTRRFLVRVCVFALSSFVGTSTAHAQSFAAGISFLNESGEVAPGVTGDVKTKDLFSLSGRAHVAIVVDGSFHQFDGFSVVTFQAGPRVTLDVGRRVMPYFQVTGGFEHCNVCSVTNAVVEPDVGVDIPIGGQPFKLRGALGVRRVFLNGTSFNETRFWIGVSFR